VVFIARDMFAQVQDDLGITHGCSIALLTRCLLSFACSAISSRILSVFCHQLSQVTLALSDWQVVQRSIYCLADLSRFSTPMKFSI
jgi:hypothetical protein